MNLIACLGNAGSGKDTVGKILVQEHGYYSLAFADPIKLFCMWMFNWNAEQLWGSSELRNEEDEQLPFVCCPTCGSFYLQLLTKADSEGIRCSACGAFTKNRLKWQRGLSPRFALQHLGTEWARALHPSCHVDFTIKRALSSTSHGVFYDPLWNALPQKVLKDRLSEHKFKAALPHCVNDRIVQMSDIRGIYISDCRFRNEVEAIRAAGGKVYRIVRHSEEDTTTTGIVSHASEMEQREIADEELDGIITNEETLDALRERLGTLIQSQS